MVFELLEKSPALARLFMENHRVPVRGLLDHPSNFMGTTEVVSMNDEDRGSVAGIASVTCCSLGSGSKSPKWEPLSDGLKLSDVGEEVFLQLLQLSLRRGCATKTDGVAVVILNSFTKQLLQEGVVVFVPCPKVAAERLKILNRGYRTGQLREFATLPDAILDGGTGILCRHQKVRFLHAVLLTRSNHG